jgi:hypothetical protein
MTSAAEPVKVLASRLKPPQFHMHGMGVLYMGILKASGHHFAHRGVLGYLPGYRDASGWHPAEAVLGERVKRQAGPEHEAVRPRFA